MLNICCLLLTQSLPISASHWCTLQCDLSTQQVPDAAHPLSHKPASFPSRLVSISGTPVHQIAEERNVGFSQDSLSHSPYLDLLSLRNFPGKWFSSSLPLLHSHHPCCRSDLPHLLPQLGQSLLSSLFALKSTLPSW